MAATASRKQFPLQYLNEEFWRVTLALNKRTMPDANLTYHYILRNDDGSLTHDWGNGRMINPASFEREDVLVIDSWNHAGFYENVFYTEPFQSVLLKDSRTDVSVLVPAGATHTFKVRAPLLAKGQTLCLLGNTATLGNWNTAAPIFLNRVTGEDFLNASLDLSKESFPIAYKYGVYDFEKKAFIRYEDGGNRILADIIAPQKHTIVNDGFVALPANTWKGAGVAIPVFSLRSENSFGVGEFADLKLLANWGKRVGLKIIQILPVNDSIATHTWTDSYPYAAISAFALHPLYLNLAQVATGRNKHLLEKLESEKKRLNALETVNYSAVVEAKLDFIKQIYPSQKQKTFKSKDYQKFFTDNQHWLKPYAVFCYLRDKYGTADFSQWPAHRTCQSKEINALADKNSDAHDEIALNYFIQYHLHLQLHEATEYARAHGIILKGDIPIGVSRYGADTWQQPELYHMNVQAGAPPDAFGVRGQNWGFPTYNWSRMMENDFAWWKQRFEQMGGYFDAFRIDHILGFFRIWSIPMHAVEGILGYFVPCIPVDVGEFESRDIRFDRDRYLQPYITEQVLWEVFGKDCEKVKRDFLHTDRFGNYSLKSKFATQRQVESHFDKLKPNARNERIKQGLYDLISNVLLFEVEGSRGRQYHFRFAIENTSSFKNLPPHTQAQLRELYIDYFFRRQDDFWRKEAMQKLPALRRVTNMLICGEDLGLVPACVPDVMRQLGLLSLEVQRMPKELNKEFSRPRAAPYLSVVTPGTHDMSTIRGWWEEDRNRTQRFYNHELGLPGEAPPHCEAWINKAVILQHLASPAMWAVLQLQDLLGMDDKLRRADFDAERINVPANPKNQWHYRMHLTLEKLLQADQFNFDLKAMIQQNDR